jgi:hypothetical protein
MCWLTVTEQSWYLILPITLRTKRERERERERERGRKKQWRS